MEDLKPKVTTDLLARCLVVLQNAEGPATAAEIARKLYLDGKFETKKRCVRAVIAELRNRAHWIIASNSEGYWLTHDELLWKDYLEGRCIDGKRIIGEASSRKRSALQDKSGQGFLFMPNKTT